MVDSSGRARSSSCLFKQSIFESPLGGQMSAMRLGTARHVLTQSRDGR